MPLDMDEPIERSSLLEHAVLACFPATGVVLAVADNKHELVSAACTLCIEHCHVLRAAFALDAPVPARPYFARSTKHPLLARIYHIGSVLRKQTHHKKEKMLCQPRQ